MERLDFPIAQKEERLEEWQKMLTRGISMMEPGAGKKGPIVTRWHLRVNINSLI
jgi:hypothetical protein